MTDQNSLEQEFQDTINALVRPAVMQVAQDVDRSVKDMRHVVKEYRNATSKHIEELADDVRALKDQLGDVRAAHEVDLQRAQAAVFASVSAADEQIRAALQQSADRACQDHVSTLAALERAYALQQNATDSAERLRIRWSEDAAALDLRLVRLHEAVDLAAGSVRDLCAAASDVAARNEAHLCLLEEVVRDLPQAPLLVDQHLSLQRDVACLRAATFDASAASQRTAHVTTWLLAFLVLLCVVAAASGTVLLSR